MRILYQILIVSLLPLVAVLLVNYYQSEHIVEISKKNTKDSLITIEKNLKELLNKKIQTYQQLSKLIINSQNIINSISTRDNNVLYTTAKQYIDSGLFSEIVFIDKNGYVIARGDNEYLFNDNIKDTLLKNIFEQKKEFNGIIEFDNKYNFIHMKPVYKFDVEFLGYIIIGESIDKNFINSINTDNLFIKINFLQNNTSINNFTQQYLNNISKYEKHNFTLAYEQLTKSNKKTQISIYKNYKKEDKILNNKHLNLSNIIIIMLVLLPILISYLTRKILSPLNNLNTILIDFKENKKQLDSTLTELKNIPSNNYEIEQIVTSVSSTLEKLLILQNNLIIEKEKSLKSDRYKSDFIENISSEISHPLVSIITFTDILKSTSLDKEQQNYLNTILKNSYKLKERFDDMILLSNLSFGSLKLDTKAVKISRLLNDIEKFFTIDIENKNLNMRLSIDSLDDNYCMFLDEDKIKKALIKLINNSIKYTKKGTIKIDFEIRKIDIENKLVDFSLSISDTGIGIDKDDYQRILNSLENSHIHYDIKNSSIGLNLSLVNQLVKLMNGKIELYTNLNEGTIFTLIFSNIKLIESSKCENTKPDKIQKSILIAGKEIKSKDILYNYFTKNYPKIKIYETQDGYETIKYSYNSENQISLIILSSYIQSMKPLSVLEYLRSNNHTSNIPILIIDTNKSNTIKKFDLVENITTDLDENSLVKYLKKLNVDFI